MPVNFGPRGCNGPGLGPGFGTGLAAYNETPPSIPASGSTD